MTISPTSTVFPLGSVAISQRPQRFPDLHARSLLVTALMVNVVWSSFVKVLIILVIGPVPHSGLFSKKSVKSFLLPETFSVTNLPLLSLPV